MRDIWCFVKKILVYLTKINKFRSLASALIILLLVLLMCLYWKNNPGVFESLKNVSLFSIILLFICYSFFLATNWLLTGISVNSLGIKIENLELTLLTIYSTLVNFFGPLQSGPGYRAIYLKSKYKMKIKDFTILSIYYYACFGFISLCMLFNSKPWILVTLVGVSIIGKIFIDINTKIFSIKTEVLVKIFSISLLQISLVSIIYFFELLIVGSKPLISSILTYTGSANLALFVGITPGAIGIRESFIVLSQNLHGIQNNQILAVSVLDRSIYFLFLGVLFVFSNVLHIRKKLLS